MKTVFDYKNELNELTFTDAQKAAMTERLLQAAAPSAEKPRRRFTKRSIVAVAAAVVCLCAVAGAAGIPKVVSDVFAPVFGTAETEIAEKFAQASSQYRDNPVALHLRGMNMLFEGLKERYIMEMGASPYNMDMRSFIAQSRYRSERAKIEREVEDREARRIRALESKAAIKAELSKKPVVHGDEFFNSHYASLRVIPVTDRRERSSRF